MKKLLLGLVLLGSFSSFADVVMQNGYKFIVSPETGKLIIIDNFTANGDIEIVKQPLLNKK